MLRTARLPNPYRPQAEVMVRCLAHMEGRLDWDAVVNTAQPWVQAVREHPPPFWAMERLLQDYPLSSAEGLALMRLAEALLRVPDGDTALALAVDQLGSVEFGRPDAQDASRLSAAVLALAADMLPDAQGPGGLLQRLGAQAVVAATRKAVRLLARQFVLGQDMAQALKAAGALRADVPGLRMSYDMLGEGARTAADARRYLEHYCEAIRAIAARSDARVPCEERDGISVKLSALHPRYEDAQHARVMGELVPRVWQLCDLAAAADLPLTIDAEESDRLELSLEVFEALAQRAALEHPDWQGLGLALQAYQTRALELVQEIIVIARRHKLRLMCRLVKGAYWDAEVKRAQELGVPHYPVFTHKQHSDVAYLGCAQALLDAPDAVYPQFATHNAASIAAVLQLATRCSAPFELQRLHGMGTGIYREVLKNPLLRCRVYAPVGTHRELLAYLVRRLLENGANAAFVHQLADPSITPAVLLATPLRMQQTSGLPLPLQIFGAQRRNSAGLDLTVSEMRAPLLQAVQTVSAAAPAVCDLGSVQEVFATAASGFESWSDRPVGERAGMLRQAADEMERHMAQWCALLVHEAFKTWGDALAEVREAVDYLRYYAMEAERIMAPQLLPGPGAGLGVTGEHNELRLRARGVWVCISPWNFPLAIFTGQVAAALVTGNTVLAKPAEQTPAVAAAAVRLLHSAGVPAAALQLLHGPGETVGAALVALPGIAGVVFTGSTQVAKTIQRALAAKDGPIVPLMAETGGVNAMVVDSSGLPEQVVDAVVQSAFRSAGQRCSALRLLCVHEAIADDVLATLCGAAAELRVGDPADFATDVGPVIDDEACENIQRQLRRLDANALRHFPPSQARAQPASARLIGPHLYEVQDVAQVREEVFGPVLQLVRWRGDPREVIRQVNALGFGLTLGLQTRIDARARALAAAARAGNVYVNRNMIGAVVGVQPFGGEGLSGTGPKAGGPHYLPRFCAEQTLTINTTAAGGNAALMARAV